MRSRFQAPLWAVLFCLAGGGFLTAQRLYNGIDLPLPNLDLPEPADAQTPSEFTFARLVYTDQYEGQILSERPWHIDSPAAERHFLQGVRRLSTIDARSVEEYVDPRDENLFDHPWLYAVEAGHWALTDEEVDRLREYLLRGGFLVFDDFHGDNEWSFFLEGIRRILPERPIEEVPAQDEVFHTLFDLEPGEQIPGIQMLFTGKTWERDGVEPHWRGIYDDERRLMVLINWNMDLGDAWEHADFPEYPERYTAAAYRLGINYLTYAMTH